MSYMDQEAQDDIPLSSAGAGLPRKLPRVLPVLPVRDTVYFPNMLFPLFLGREKSIRALDYALEKHRYLLLVAQKEVSVEDPGTDDIYTVGTIAEVMQVLRVPDGTVRVTLEGVDRAKITKFLHTEPFFKANIKVISSRRVADAKAEALMRSVTSFFDQIVQNQGLQRPAHTSGTADERRGHRRPREVGQHHNSTCRSRPRQAGSPRGGR